MDGDDALLAYSGTRTQDCSAIPSEFSGRPGKPGLAHWPKVVNPDIVRGSWTFHEDHMILHWIGMEGTSHWSQVAAQALGRIAKAMPGRMTESPRSSFKDMDPQGGRPHRRNHTKNRDQVSAHPQATARVDIQHDPEPMEFDPATPEI
jgi:hypothetical protein